jgi:hypothetical protein
VLHRTSGQQWMHASLNAVDIPQHLAWNCVSPSDFNIIYFDKQNMYQEWVVWLPDRSVYRPALTLLLVRHSTSEPSLLLVSGSSRPTCNRDGSSFYDTTDYASCLLMTATFWSKCMQKCLDCTAVVVVIGDSIVALRSFPLWLLIISSSLAFQCVCVYTEVPNRRTYITAFS